jgi:hypothetical protein
MRFTVLKQMAKGISIPDANPDDPDDHPERLLESAKWYLWHGNVHQSLERIDTLIQANRARRENCGMSRTSQAGTHAQRTL